MIHDRRSAIVLPTAVVFAIFIAYALLRASDAAPEVVSADDEVVLENKASAYQLMLDKGWATSARPEIVQDRCYQEDRCWSSCQKSGRQAGTQELIPFAPVQDGKGWFTSLFSCWDYCCPADPPVGTCYNKHGCWGCADGYEKVASKPLAWCDDLCCTPGSCFWYKTHFPHACGCPGNTQVVDQTGECHHENSWWLCCPEGEYEDAQLSHMPVFDLKLS